MNNTERRYGGYNLDKHETSGLLCQMIPKGSRVLDVGCGDGSLALMMVEHRNASVIGLEPDKYRASLANENGIHTLQSELNSSLADEIGKFDVVLFADVLEHLPKSESVLRDAQDFLAPGGFVLLSVPNVAHLSMRINLLKGNFDYTTVGIMDSTHLRWFTKKTLFNLLETTGYKILESYSSAGLWDPYYKFRRPWRWIKRSWTIRFVLWGVAHYPNLFGYQNIIKAEPHCYKR